LRFVIDINTISYYINLTIEKQERTQDLIKNRPSVFRVLEFSGKGKHR